MKKQKPPEQIKDLLEKIRGCIEEGRYLQSDHAIDRGNERKIGLSDALYVLKTGHHEKAKTKFDETHNTWKYAIRGNSLERLDIRVIVAFNEDGVLIITVMNVSKN